MLGESIGMGHRALTGTLRQNPAECGHSLAGEKDGERWKTAMLRNGLLEVYFMNMGQILSFAALGEIQQDGTRSFYVFYGAVK